MRPKNRESDRCLICGRHCSVYDRSSIIRSWRALDFAGILVYINALYPADQMSEARRSGCCRSMGVPRFRIHQEALILTATWMAEDLSRSAVAEYPPDRLEDRCPLASQEPANTLSLIQVNGWTTLSTSESMRQAIVRVTSTLPS